MGNESSLPTPDLSAYEYAARHGLSTPKKYEEKVGGRLVGPLTDKTNVNSNVKPNGHPSAKVIDRFS